MATLLGFRTGLALMSDQTSFDRVADAIAREDGLDRETAGKALDQAIIFIHAAGQHYRLGLVPSKTVDIAWDRLVLYSHIYADLCQRLAGRFIHHTPLDAPVRLPEGHRILTVAETFELLRQDGYWVKEEVWDLTSPPEAKANCTVCYTGDHDSGEVDDT